MSEFSGRACAEVRDRVYALRSLAVVHGRRVIEVDYTLPVYEVYRAAIHLIIEEDWIELWKDLQYKRRMMQRPTPDDKHYSRVFQALSWLIMELKSKMGLKKRTYTPLSAIRDAMLEVASGVGSQFHFADLQDIEKRLVASRYSCELFLKLEELDKVFNLGYVERLRKHEHKQQ